MSGGVPESEHLYHNQLVWMLENNSLQKKIREWEDRGKFNHSLSIDTTSGLCPESELGNADCVYLEFRWHEDTEEMDAAIWCQSRHKLCWKEKRPFIPLTTSNFNFFQRTI